MIIEELTNDVENIYFPYPKTTWTSELKYEKISRITLCAGNETWYEYVERIHYSIMFIDAIRSYTRVDGTEVKINPHFIVEVEDFTMASASYYTSSLSTHKGVVRYIFSDENDPKIKLVDEYVDEW